MKFTRALNLAALLVLWQLANAGGYFWQRFFHPAAPASTNAVSPRDTAVRA